MKVYEKRSKRGPKY